VSASAACRSRLDDLAVLRVSGEDARSFLHGQLTADVRRLRPGHGRYAAWCSPKGRVLFLLSLLDAGDAFLLVLPASEAAACAKRLRMFVLRARVTVEELSDSWRVLGVASPTAAALRPLAGIAPGATVAVGDGLGWRLPSAGELSHVLGPRAAVDALWAACAADPAVDLGAWESREIEAGLPRIAGPLAERFLPQELGLEALDGLHFDKGCYPGQEVVARLKYRGQLKVGLRRATSEYEVAPGDRLYRAGAPAAAGEVLRVAQGEGVSRVLAVVDLDAAGSLHLRGPDGPALRLDA
jgi:folate-binding protein YgfZ